MSHQASGTEKPRRARRRAVASLTWVLALAFAAVPAAFAQGGSLRVAMAGSPPTLDFMCSFASQARDYGVYIFESLVTLDQEYNVAPQLAESWDVSDDHMTFTFHLRDGVTFHNGAPLTAADVVASFQRFLEVSPRQADFGSVSAMRAVDDLTFEVQLDSVSAAFLPLLAYPGPAVAIMPADVIEGRACGSLDAASIIGTGPYELAEWIPDQHVHLTRFEDYAPSKIGRAHV